MALTVVEEGTRVPSVEAYTERPLEEERFERLVSRDSLVVLWRERQLFHLEGSCSTAEILPWRSDRVVVGVAFDRNYVHYWEYDNCWILYETNGFCEEKVVRRQEEGVVEEQIWNTVAQGKAKSLGYHLEE